IAVARARSASDRPDCTLLYKYPLTSSPSGYLLGSSLTTYPTNTLPYGADGGVKSDVQRATLDALNSSNHPLKPVCPATLRPIVIVSDIISSPEISTVL